MCKILCMFSRSAGNQEVSRLSVCPISSSQEGTVSSLDLWPLKLRCSRDDGDGSDMMTGISICLDLALVQGCECMGASLRVHVHSIVSVASIDRPWCGISQWWNLTLVASSIWPTGRKLPQTGSQPYSFFWRGPWIECFSFSLNSEEQENQGGITQCFLLWLSLVVLRISSLKHTLRPSIIVSVLVTSKADLVVCC